MMFANGVTLTAFLVLDTEMPIPYGDLRELIRSKPGQLTIRLTPEATAFWTAAGVRKATNANVFISLPAVRQLLVSKSVGGYGSPALGFRITETSATSPY